ncbi:hypothetical protein FS842_006711 [Serendipita sp. 407]|nr:hypothetical protein FS842_006711 [Serendipita sp. 407]
MPRSAGSNHPGNNRNPGAPPYRQGHARNASGGGAIKRKRKMGSAPVEPPELKHIPQLLPLFLEMIQPLMRPQAIN